jgi:tetratricopeptide (TPR) repeat protein
VPPVADIAHVSAPVWIAAALVFAATFALAYFLITRGRRDNRRSPESTTASLSTEQVALIERALAACAPELASAMEGVQPTGADPRAMLRAALSYFLRMSDPRGRRVATLLAERHIDEARDLAAAMAGEIPIRASAGEALRSRAANAWMNAGIVAYLNDVKAAIAACERARELGAADFLTQAWLGALYFRRGRLGEAEAAFNAAEALLGPEENVNRAALLGNLGDVALKRGDRPAARTLFERALAIYTEMGAWEHEWARHARASLAKLRRG